MHDSLHDLGEFNFIRHITSTLPADATVLEKIGDDCSVVRLGKQTLLLTCDASIEGIHFDLSYSPPSAVGWRAAASAISDIAAMGGRARFLLVTFAAPPDTTLEICDQIFKGIKSAAAAAGALIVGGDTTRSASGIAIDISVIGEPSGKRWLSRKSAKPGDLVLVTGYPGHSGAGLLALQRSIKEATLIKAHHHPVPRLPEGQWLAAQRDVHAMIDLSDGILADTAHIAGSSSVSINFHSASFPVSPALRRCAARLNRTPIDLILTGGEDYELLFTAKRSNVLRLLRDFSQKFPLPLNVVGEVIEASPSAVLLDNAPPTLTGFEHF